jgi:hypothetical protein
MDIHSIDDLRLMFQERIAIETPEAAAKLFELRDADKWQAEYRVSADGRTGRRYISRPVR